jgi:hypothetical protein
MRILPHAAEKNYLPVWRHVHAEPTLGHRSQSRTAGRLLQVAREPRSLALQLLVQLLQLPEVLHLSDPYAAAPDDGRRNHDEPR